MSRIYLTQLSFGSTRRQRVTLLSFLLLIPFLVSCEKAEILSCDTQTLVVEGWIASNEHPVVMLTTNVAVSTSHTDNEALLQHLMRYARVTISDGDKEVVLIGKHDKRYMPPYIYTTTDMVGMAGRQYMLTASVDTFYATAITTIPESVEIDSISQGMVEGNDGVRKLYVNFLDPTAENHYCLFYRTGKYSPQLNLCGVGVFSDANLAGNVRYPVYRTANLSEKYGNMCDLFDVGDTVCVQLTTVDRQSFQFWNDFQNLSSLSGNFVMPYTKNIRSNINGGKGYWSGFGISRRILVVGEEK